MPARALPLLLVSAACGHHSLTFVDALPRKDFESEDILEERVGIWTGHEPPNIVVGDTSASTLFFNASVVHSMDDGEAISAWCVQGGRFTALGSYNFAAKTCGSNASVTNLNGAVVVPGFIDAHLHLLYGGFKLARPQLDQCNSPEEVVSLLKAYVAKHPLPSGAWLQGFGWDQERFPNRQFPNRADLDAAFPTTPVWLGRIDGHAAWSNSELLRRVPPLPPVDPEGGRIIRDPHTHAPTGVFTDAAMELVAKSIPAPTDAQTKEALALALSLCARSGVTAIADPGIELAQLDLFKSAIDNGTFSLRSHAMALGVASGLGVPASPDTAQIRDYGGRLSFRAVKFFLDGALGSRGAALIHNYSDAPHEHGQLRMRESEFRRNVSAWLAKGWQIATHAIGDLANRIVLDTYGEHCGERRDNHLAAEPSAPNGADTSSQVNGGPVSSAVDERAAPDLRLRIEHFQIVNASDIARIHSRGEVAGGGHACMLASMQPTHATSDMAFAEARLGAERLNGAYAWQSVIDAGAAALPMGSDWPTVGQVPPLLGLHAAVTRQDMRNAPAGGWLPAQCVSRTQAMRGYTTDAAFAMFQEGALGKLRRGFYADFVALDRDVLDESAVAAEDIWMAAVLATWSGGTAVWEHPCWKRRSQLQFPDSSSSLDGEHSSDEVRTSSRRASEQVGRTVESAPPRRMSGLGPAMTQSRSSSKTQRKRPTPDLGPPPSSSNRALSALRQCVETARARAQPSESALARLTRLAAANGDGCPF